MAELDGSTAPVAIHGFRINAPRDAEMVEVSINEGPWLPCRRVEGFWLSDWSNFELGKYRLRARMRTSKDGKARTTLLRLPTGDPLDRPAYARLRHH
jgi:hypothetical protein